LYEPLIVAAKTRDIRDATDTKLFSASAGGGCFALEVFARIFTSPKVLSYAPGSFSMNALTNPT